MKSSEKKEVPPSAGQTIQVPRTQVTGNPKRGYTTEDFWRDQAAGHGAPEFDRFSELTSRLVRVSKGEVDERRTPA